jgi:hypothetical protein
MVRILLRVRGNQNLDNHTHGRIRRAGARMPGTPTSGSDLQQAVL